MMELVGQAVAAQQMQTQNEIQTSVAAKAMDNQKMMGELIVQMISDASQVGQGKAPGLGERFDAVG